MRDLNGSSDYITLSAGTVPAGISAGDFTLAFIGSLDTVGRWNTLIDLLTSGNANEFDFVVTSSNVLSLVRGSGGAGGTVGTVTGIGTGAQYLSISKASGTQAPVGRRYIYSTDAWTHTTSGSTMPNASGAVAKIVLGAFENTADFIDGQYAAAVVWDRVVPQDEQMNFPFSLLAILASNPVALVLLDQSSTSQKIVDLTGHGANESAIVGTSVSTTSLPVFSYGAPMWIADAASAGGGGTTTPLTLSASTASSVVLVKQANAIRAASTASSAVVVRQVNAIRSCSSAGSAVIVRRVNKILTASSASAAAIASSKVALLTLSCSTAASASIAMVRSRVLTLVATSVASVVLARDVRKTLTVASPAAANLAAINLSAPPSASAGQRPTMGVG